MSTSEVRGLRAVRSRVVEVGLEEGVDTNGTPCSFIVLRRIYRSQYVVLSRENVGLLNERRITHGLRFLYVKDLRARNCYVIDICL